MDPGRREATRRLCVEVCGSACCRTPSMQVPVDEWEAVALTLQAQQLGVQEPPIMETDEGLRMVMGRGGRCVFLNDATGLCRVYKGRPGACRKFPGRPTDGCLVWPDESDEPRRGVARGKPRRKGK